MPSRQPLAQEIELVWTDDGSLHEAPKRLAIETRHNTSHYELPEFVGDIVHIRIIGHDIPRPLTIFECPASVSYYHLFGNGTRPQTPNEARLLLRRANDKFGRALWFRLQNSLYLHPAPPNAGDTLLVDYYAKPPLD